MLYYMSNKPDEEWWVENIAWWAEYIACSDYATPSVVYWEAWAKMAVKPGWNVHTSVLWA